MTLNLYRPRGRRPYPFCQAKCQFDVLGGWVGKNKFIMAFCATKWFQKKSNLKEKNINKNTKFCLYRGTLSRRVIARLPRG